jgi:hypothetical protein
MAESGGADVKRVPCAIAAVTLTGSNDGSALDLPLLLALDAVEAALAPQPRVRRMVSLATLLKRLSFVMYDSKPEMNRIPNQREVRTQFLLLPEMAGEPDELDHLNEGTESITNVLQLNMLSDLADCGRGGNLAYATIEEAGFLSTDPDSPDFLKPGPNSPLLDKGLDLPFTCADKTAPKEKLDLTNQSIPCGDSYEPGCHEWCD